MTVARRRILHGNVGSQIAAIEGEITASGRGAAQSTMILSCLPNQEAAEVRGPQRRRKSRRLASLVS